MGKCPTCGASLRFGSTSKQCAKCGKIVCNSCLQGWQGTLGYKKDWAGHYGTMGFCTVACFNKFWQAVFEFPLDYHIGTDVDNFPYKINALWNGAILAALAKSDPSIAPSLVEKGNLANQLGTDQAVAFLYRDNSGKPVWMWDKFIENARKTLAQNLEKCGRTQDAAKIYEDMRLYDKARELREKDRHLTVKKTDISVDLNALLAQVKDGGIVAVFRCPHCGGKLKIDDKTKLGSLKKCVYCNSEIESMDLADFLKAVLSQ